MTDRTQSATVYDVASQAGVSIATVSRWLNSPELLSEKARLKVTKAAEKLGYSPKFAARAMAGGRTRMIGAVIPTMANAVFAIGLQAFQEELESHGFTLVVATSNYERDNEKKQIMTLASRGIEGLLLVGYDRHPDVYKFLDEQMIPKVVTWAFDLTKNQPAVGFDNHQASREMAREMVKLGHKKMGLISLDVVENDRVRSRKEGIEQAIRETGRSVTDLKTVFASHSVEDGSKAFERLMKADPDLTVIFCSNDVLAVGALRGAKELGINVPDDVSVVGFDDIELSQVTSPLLTTVHVPHRRMGRAAACQIIKMQSDPTLLKSVQMQTELVLRESHGPARTKRD